MTVSRDDELLAYLSGELTPDERHVFEARLASDSALRSELDAWRSMAQARQRTYNAESAPDRERALMAQLDALHIRGTSAGPQADNPAGGSSVYAKAPGMRESLRGWIRSASTANPLFPMGWALSAVLAVVVVLQASWTGAVGDPILTRGGSGSGCFVLRVDLPHDLPVATLRNVLAQYLVRVDGPDSDGRFLLLARRETSLLAAAKALNVRALDASGQANCQIGQP